MKKAVILISIVVVLGVAWLIYDAYFSDKLRAPDEKTPDSGKGQSKPNDPNSEYTWTEEITELTSGTEPIGPEISNENTDNKLAKGK